MAALLIVSAPERLPRELAARLEQGGHAVAHAASSREGFAAAKRSRVDLVLLDRELPSVERWHLIKRLSSDPATRRVHVLLLAERDAVTDVDRVVAEVHRALQQAAAPRPAPVASEDSFDLVADSLASTSDVFPDETLAATAERKPRILVVDDNALNRDLLTRRLARRGYAAEATASGQAALELLGTTPFDLVVLDWMMPEMSGIEFLHRARQTWSAAALPVLMATAKTEPEDLVTALDAGANDFVTKPLQFDVVLARVRTHLELAAVHRRLAESEARYRALLENTGDLVLLHDLQGRMRFVSPTVRSLLGHEPETFVRRRLWDWLHPEDRGALARHSEPPHAGYTYIARISRSNADWLWIEASNRAVEGGVHCVLRDITELLDRAGTVALPAAGEIMPHPSWRGPVGSSPPQPR